MNEQDYEQDWLQAVGRLGGTWTVAGGRSKEKAKSDGAFFTKPTAAVLLAELSIGGMNVDWSNEEEVANLKVMDPACGDGTLLLAALGAIIKRAGLKAARAFAQKNLMGIDIDFPSVEAAKDRLMLIYPDLDRDQLSLTTFPHGPMPDGSVRAGAIELLHIDFTGDVHETKALVERPEAGTLKQGDLF